MEKENYDDLSAEEILNLFDMDNNDVVYGEILEKYGLDIRQLEKEMINSHPKLKLIYHKLHADAIEPKYNYDLDSGFDFHSVEDITIPPFGRALIPTGLSFDLPDNHEMQVRSKSGLAIKQGLMVLNSPGTVDKGYLGEIKVILFNVNNHEVLINKGMKVAQGVICPVVSGKWLNVVCEKINIENSQRQDKGFGSTGI